MFSKLITIQITLILCLALQTYAAKSSSNILLGPTGIEGEISKNSIKVTNVQKNSPADGYVQPGDKIVGLNSRKFGKNPKREIAVAIDHAESKEAAGKMLLMLNGGKTVTIKLQILGSYSPTAPYNCSKTEKIITQTAERILKSKLDKGSRLHPELLGLMATGEKKYIQAAKRAIKNAPWAQPDPKQIKLILQDEINQGPTGWIWGYNLITLAEYYLLTKDKSVLPAIKIYAIALAKGQDAVGLWGHRMASPKRFGRLPGYAQMNQSSMSCFLGMLLAKKCGIIDSELDKGIKKTYDYVASHINRGSFAYGVHGPNTKNFNNNGSSASAAICMLLADNNAGAQFFSQLTAASYDGLETGHASAFFNPFWSPMGAHILGPEVTQQFFKKSLWFHNLRRNWDGSWSPSWKEGPHEGVALLTYCLPRKALYITGRIADQSIWLDAEAATAAIEVTNIDYKNKSADELILLTYNHPLPQIRRLASAHLLQYRKELHPTWVKYLKEGTAEEKKLALSQYGWWIPLEDRLPDIDAIGAIVRDMKAPIDLRLSAVESICHMGPSAEKYYMDIVKLINLEKPNDIFGEIDAKLAKCASTISKNPLEDSLINDKNAFYQAALKLADNKRQDARANGLQMLSGIPLEDFHKVADKVMHVINDQDGTYHSYHNPGSAVAAGIIILANLNIREGIKLALEIENNPSGKHSFKMKATWEVLSKYGSNAQDALKVYQKRSNNRGNYGRHTAAYNKMVKAVTDSKPGPKLISFEEAKNLGR